VFKQSYTPVTGSAHEYRKTGYIIARQINEPFSIKTVTGAIEHGLCDDFLVQNDATEQWIIECRLFHELYEVAPKGLIDDDHSDGDDEGLLPYTNDSKTETGESSDNDDGDAPVHGSKDLGASLELHDDDVANIRAMLQRGNSDLDSHVSRTKSQSGSRGHADSPVTISPNRTGPSSHSVSQCSTSHSHLNSRSGSGYLNLLGAK
jgi:hypothetical protein